ncbi:hypothetical protein LUZ60_008786 [Juncus effusus]|nr:hypothetical protein LUZ60_008786 [Juncus effusus]
MESPFSYSIVLFFPLVLPLVFFIFLKYKTTSKPTLKLPPGPRPLPLIGNLHNLFGSLPHHAFRDLSRQYGSVFLLWIGETPNIIISSPEVAKEVMKLHDLNFSTRPISRTVRIISYGGKGLFFSPYGEYWRELRKICTLELLSTKRVESFRSIREEEVGNLIGHISSCLSDGQLVNLSKALGIMVNDMSARIIIGSKCKNQEMFLKELFVMMELASGSNLVDLFPSSRLASLMSGAEREAKRCCRELDCFLDDVIKQHRERKTIEGNGELEQEDFVQVLLRIHDDGKHKDFIDMQTVKKVIFDALAAGSENATTILEWAMSELIRNPRVMKEAQSEIRELLKGCTNVSESDLINLKYLHLVITETLRLHPPVPLLIPRQCQETCRISGYDIPKGASVLVNAWTICRDPKYWEDPEEFKPERFINSSVDFKGTDFEFLPFGAGRRMCPGMSFGLANIELPLASLLYHFDWNLPNGITPEEIDMSESFKIALQRKTHLHLLPVPYKLCVV